MKQSDIDYLNNLDPLQLYGTLQLVLQDADLQATPIDKVLRYLVERLIVEKMQLEKENAKLSSVLKDHGLYTSALMLED